MKEYFEKIYSDTEQKFHDLVDKNIVKNKKMFIVTANPETLMIAEENNEFKECLLKEDTIIVPDGIGIVKGAKMCGYNINETITGVELAKKIFEICNREGKSLYLFGAKSEVLDKMNEMLKTKYPKIKLLGSENGYVKDRQKVFDKIVELKPDVVLVALGIPHQELLIYRNLSKIEKGIFVGVGGSFDVLSGCKKRAPKIFIKLHLEWLYRITVEPKRLKRFFKSNIRYLSKIRKEKKG